MKRILLIFILLIPLFNWGQINYSINWDGAADPIWNVSANAFSVTNEVPCQGTHSVRVRVRGNQAPFNTSVLTSNSLGATNGGEVNFSFDYKWLEFKTNITSNPIGAPGNRLELKWQWANYVGGPWYTFKTIDANNHVQSADCVNETSSFTPYAGSNLFVRLIVSNTNATGDNYFYLDNVDIFENQAIDCKMPRNVSITKKTSNAFTINWRSSGQAVQNYEWEVRTSGEPGSGPVGLVGTTPAPGTTNATFVDVTGLLPDTKYIVYVRSNCTATESSHWIGVDTITFCNPPNFSVPSNIDICGVQEVELDVTGVGAGTTYWYDIENNLLDKGVNKYVTPSLNESVVYKVFCGILDQLEGIVGIGSGAATITDAVPFTGFKANKSQYIYLADELKAAGFNRGIIKGFGFLVGGGTLHRKGFEISMGLTPLEDFGTNDFIEQNQLEIVKNQSDQVLVAGTRNMFALDKPFLWDGVSNIVVQIVYSDLSTTPSLTGVVGTNFSSVNLNRSLSTGSNDDTFTLLKMKTVTKGTRSEFRVNGHFDVLEGCFGEMKTISINYKEAPKFVLSDSIVNNCTGQPLQKIYVLTGANDYDTYEWEPNDPNDPNDPNNASNAITGDQNVGWTFNPTTNMTYYLTVKNSTGEKCINYKEIKVELNPSPTMLQLLDDYNLCYNDIQELKVDNFVNDEPSSYSFNGNLDNILINNTVIGDAISNDTTLFSEGNGSLKISYGAQTNATVDFNSPINMRNLKSVIVEFDHIAALQSTNSLVMDFGYIEYTTDNGVTWKPFLPTDYTGGASKTLPTPVNQTGFLGMFFTKTSYPEWATISETGGVTNTMWKSEKFVVPASDLIGTGTFKIRFRVGSDGNTQYDGWYVDNVKITPVSNYEVSWSPIANLYYDQNATEPYDGLINSGTLYLKGNSNVKNLPYKVTVANQFGCSVEKTFNVSIGLDEVPVVNNLDSCGPINVNNTGFSKNPNGLLTYYNSQTSSTPITQITTSGVYYVEQEISGCKSQRVPFTVIINVKPTDPVAPLIQNFCSAATIDDLKFNSVAGFQIKWYSTPNGGTALAGTTPLMDGGSYYAEFNKGVCTSDNRVKVDVTVGTTPAAISVNDIYICGTSTINDITVPSATGATVNWYQNINDTNALAGTTVLASGVYYVAQKIGSCESTRTAVNVSTIQNLVAPTANTQTFCGSATVGDLTASGISTGATVNWYSLGTADTPLASSTPLTSGTYYVAQSIGNCESTKRAVAVKIISVNAPVINPISICGDATVGTLPLNASVGTGYKVYATAFATTEMNQSDVVTSGTYYISKVESGCETSRATVQITVTPRPNAPTGNVKQSFNDYAEVKDLKMNETNVIWFNSSNDALANANQLPTYTALQNNKTYYAVVVGPNGCTSLPTAVTVTITLGLNDLDLASLKYWPNPVDSELTVSYKEPIRSIEIYDILGKQIKVQKFETNEVRLDVSTLSAGTYMLKVQTDTGSQFVKIVKK